MWGGLGVHSKSEPFPRDTEARLLNFTDLVATAIANTNARAEVSRLADEQAALRRVATLVAQGASVEVISVVSDEVGRLFGSDQAAVARYEPDGSGVVFVGVSQGMPSVAIGTRWPLEDYLAMTTVYRTGRSATKERGDYVAVSGPIADSLREMNFVSRIAAPIIVEGNLWGVMTVNDAHERLAPDAEERVAKFTELVATAIANAESRGELAASRARVIAAADEARRRIERDLHDGAQRRRSPSRSPCARWKQRRPRDPSAARSLGSRRSDCGGPGAPRALTRHPSSRPHAGWACPRAQSPPASLPSSRHARHTLRAPAP